MIRPSKEAQLLQDLTNPALQPEQEPYSKPTLHYYLGCILIGSSEMAMALGSHGIEKGTYNGELVLPLMYPYRLRNYAPESAQEMIETVRRRAHISRDFPFKQPQPFPDTIVEAWEDERSNRTLVSLVMPRQFKAKTKDALAITKSRLAEVNVHTKRGKMPVSASRIHIAAFKAGALTEAKDLITTLQEFDTTTFTLSEAQILSATDTKPLANHKPA